MSYMLMALKEKGTKTGEPLTRKDGSLRLYKTGKTAQRAAVVASKKFGCKVQPRVAPTEDWREREKQRFHSGEYTPIRSESWPNYGKYPDHFAHVSQSKKSMVAFTPSEEYGQSNRKLRMSPGTYLSRYYPELTTGDTTYIARAFGARYDELECHIATERQEIREVYENGPESCMSKTADDYSSCPVHPTEAYAAGDLGVAYMHNADGEISARTIVWPKKKIYGRVYGDFSRLDAALKQRGYRYARDDNAAWAGAKLLKIRANESECTSEDVPDDDDGNPCDNDDYIHYVMPYLDTCAAARIEGDYFVLDPSSSGKIGLGSTSGVIALRKCFRCKNADTGQGRLVETADGSDRYFCRDCSASSNGIYRCDCSGRRMVAERRVAMANGETWSRNCFEQDGEVCALNGRNYARGDCARLVDGRTVSREEMRRRNLQYCHRCNGYALPDVPCTHDLFCETKTEQPDPGPGYYDVYRTDNGEQILSRINGQSRAQVIALCERHYTWYGPLTARFVQPIHRATSTAR